MRLWFTDRPYSPYRPSIRSCQYIFSIDYPFLSGYREIMPTDKPKVFIVLGKGLLERIEDFRYSNRIPTRSQAIRRLIEEGLKRYEKNSQNKP